MRFEEEFPSLYIEDKYNLSGSIGKEFENRGVMKVLKEHCLDKQRVKEARKKTENACLYEMDYTVEQVFDYFFKELGLEE